MPDFNTFRTNEMLLGQVLVARQNVDLSASEDEQMEVRQFLHELEEKNRQEQSSLFVRFISFITGKKYVQLKDRFGQKIIREVTNEEQIKPMLKISLTVKRDIDFGDDVNEWRRYIHEQNILSEKKEIENREHEKHRHTLIEAYSQIINRAMMKIN